MGEGAGVSRESTLIANWISERLESVNPFPETKCGEGAGNRGGSWWWQGINARRERNGQRDKISRNVSTIVRIEYAC